MRQLGLMRNFALTCLVAWQLPQNRGGGSLHVASSRLSDGILSSDKLLQRNRVRIWFKHRQVTDLDVADLGFSGPRIPFGPTGALRISLDHFSKHLSSVLGRTALCHKVRTPGPQKPQIIRNEKHHLVAIPPTSHRGAKVGVLWKCSGKCSWGCSGKSGCSGGCSRGCSGKLGVLQAVLSRVLFLLTTTGGAPSRALPGAPPISLSTLWNTTPSTPISLSTLRSNSQSTFSENSHFSTPVTGRRDGNQMALPNLMV